MPASWLYANPAAKVIVSCCDCVGQGDERGRDDEAKGGDAQVLHGCEMPSLLARQGGEATKMRVSLYSACGEDVSRDFDEEELRSECCVEER